MKRTLEKLKQRLRPLKYLALASTGYLYDYYRYFKHGAWRQRNLDSSMLDYKLVKIYHRLEKSMSFRERRSSSGWDAAVDFIREVRKSPKQPEAIFQKKIGSSVLARFYSENSPEAPRSEKVVIVEDYLNSEKSKYGNDTGYKLVSREFLLSGKLDTPENFFYSRYSVRDFSPHKVSHEDIQRAIALAQKTPSVCSRQAWHVYLLDDDASIKKALSFQNGNSGFGHEVPCLLIITSDLNAFDVPSERYQHWIDGGMFSMSVVYALHSIGIGSCCLNWSKGISDDLNIRKVIPIKDSHSIMMMVAVGYPNDSIKVCASARRPIQQILSKVHSLK